ncbi:TetR/AcrR family transcriptional regulator [Sphingobium yanoikuyae]|uniref:TetR/AcrR family transcriptional regulator n=1 Tax=Sphingobium yanoikuyae TaxID=13690 RepID=UPI003B8FDAA2
MDFQRARSGEQRDQRRRVILATASAMLAEMSVAEISLNELSRRVGLAKSNVLRYFESREAVLLQLLNDEIDAWIAALDLSGISSDADIAARANLLAQALANSLAARATLCDLISSQAAVLERNVSADVVLQHKRAVNVSVGVLGELLTSSLPEMPQTDIYHLIVTLFLTAAGAWPHGQPTEALLAAYAADPGIGAHSTDFVAFMRNSLELTILGLHARRSCSEDKSNVFE